jgi:hypothetical protein
MTKKAAALIDKRIEAAYYRTCDRITIPMMKIPAVFAAGRAALAAGADEAGLEHALTSYVATIRVSP